MGGSSEITFLLSEEASWVIGPIWDADGVMAVRNEQNNG